MADIKTSSALVKFLERVAEESVREVLPTVFENERKKQGKMDKDLAGLRASDTNKKDDVEEEEDPKNDGAEEESGADGEKKIVKKDVTKLGSADKAPKDVDIPTSKEVLGAGLRDVIDQLNMIRSGTSLKDEKVRKNLDVYVSSLSSGERQSLFIFLNGISQIVSSGVSGSESPKPGAVGITVKGKEAKKGSTKKSSPDTPAEKAKEPDSGEAPPIIVGESASKDDILKRVKKLMRRV